MTFDRADLLALGRLLDSAERVVPMRVIYEGMTDPNVIGMRHDVDDNMASLQTALEIAKWERSQGYRSTFYFLHTARYWSTPHFPSIVEQIAYLGHEVGIHADAITEALLTGQDPAVFLSIALERLRSISPTPVVGVAAHGARLCRQVGYVNDEMFTECARPEMGAPDRLLRFGSTEVRLNPKPLAWFGLLYDTHRLPHGRYLSDSGGSWNEPFPGKGSGQLHILQHPDWWPRAFAAEKLTA